MDEETKKLLPLLILTGLLVLFLLRVFLCSSLGLKPYITKHPDKDRNIERSKDIGVWAESNGFSLLGFYTVLYGTVRMFLAAWESIEKPMYLCQYIIELPNDSVVTADFTTIFEGEVDLTTDESKATHLFPKPPWSYCQTFPKANIDERYRMHLEAEKYLEKEGWLKLKKSPIDFEEEFVGALKRQKRWERKHLYWIFVIPYFYLFRRRKWHNKTIQQQHELGMKRLPNEIHLRQPITP